MKIGNHVITFHRPEIQKETFPSEKDRAIANMRAPRRPPPAHKPLVEVSALTPYNRMSSTAAVNKAIDRLAETGTPREIVNCVRGQIRAHVAANGRTPSQLLLGDVHGEPAGLMMVVAALYEYRDITGPKTFSIETTPNSARLAEEWIDARPQLLAHCMNRNVRLPFPGIKANMTRLMTACMVARAHGFRLNGCDPLKKTVTDLVQRERAMVTNLRNAAPPGGAHVVFTGNGHLPVLRDALQAPGSTLCITMAPSAIKAGESETRNRWSYLLSTPQVEKIKPSMTLRSGELDAVQFIKRELPPWIPPVL